MSSVKLTGNRSVGIKELAYNLRREINADLLSECWREFDGISIVLLVFEKFYFRSGNFASLTVMLTERENEQTADITGSGGGSGIFNISLGANTNFVQAAKKLLEHYGFE